MFGISGWEMVGLAVVALLVFGPDRLPRVAADAGRFLRQVRVMVAGARRDLSEGLGPEFEGLDVADLDPRSFVRRHLLDPVDVDVEEGEGGARGGRNGHRGGGVPRVSGGVAGTPYDPDAT